jgi:hypothetical protein
VAVCGVISDLLPLRCWQVNTKEPSARLWAYSRIPSLLGFPLGVSSTECHAICVPCLRAFCMNSHLHNKIVELARYLTNVSIVDQLTVPKETPTGEYVLQLRYDCEESAQIWSFCADLTIVNQSP